MLTALVRTLTALCSAVLMLAALCCALVVLFTIPLDEPSAIDACAEPCFGPPADSGDVAAGTAFAAVAAAICAALGAGGLALPFVAVGMAPRLPRRLLLAPVAGGGLVVLAVSVAQAIAALS